MIRAIQPYFTINSLFVLLRNFGSPLALQFFKELVGFGALGVALALLAALDRVALVAGVHARHNVFWTKHFLACAACVEGYL